MTKANGTQRIMRKLAKLLVFAGLGVALLGVWPEFAYLVGLPPNMQALATRIELGQVTSPKAASSTKAKSTGSRVIIGKVEIDSRIYEGNAERALERGVYRHAGSARPGQRGNVVIAGHRTSHAFALLHMLKSGDRITVRWKGKAYRYRVKRVYEVNAVNTSVLKRAGRDRLTLYTCTPRFLGNKRTVVVAYPVKGK